MLRERRDGGFPACSKTLSLYLQLSQSRFGAGKKMRALPGLGRFCRCAIMLPVIASFSGRMRFVAAATSADWGLSGSFRRSLAAQSLSVAPRRRM